MSHSNSTHTAAGTTPVDALVMPQWEVQIKGDIHDRSKGFELAVVRCDNEFGRQSWGWGGTGKIILFSTGHGGNQLNPRTDEGIAFAESAAKKLCDALNEDDGNEKSPAASE